MNQENTNPVNSILTKKPWEQEALTLFESVLIPIPGAIRGIAESRVSKKAKNLALEKGNRTIRKKDIVTAFFAKTPPGFISMMRARMNDLHIDYQQYGYQ